MTKRLIALSLVVVLAALVIVPMAIGKSGNRHAKGKSKFQLNGVVVSTDTAANTIVVKVKSGNKAVKAYRGQELTVAVAPTARLTDATVDPVVATTLDAFVTGAKVHLGGTIDRSDLANPICIGKKLILQEVPAAAPAPSPSPSVTP